MTTAPHLHRGTHHSAARVQHHPNNHGRNRSVSAPRMAIELELGRIRATAGASLTPQRLASLTGANIKTVRRILQSLRIEGLAANTGTTAAPMWRLTEPGAHIDADSRSRVKNSTTSGPYDPVELRPFDGRPGAMDAFLLPSVVNGKHVPARRITAQCVGTVVERANKGWD